MATARQDSDRQQNCRIGRAAMLGRLSIGLALLAPAALLNACSSPGRRPESSVPAILIGHWDGGSAGESDYQLNVAANGAYVLFNHNQPSLRDEGYLEVVGKTLTTYSDEPGNAVSEYLGVEACTWQVTEWTEYGITMQTLWLCGDAFSYLR